MMDIATITIPDYGKGTYFHFRTYMVDHALPFIHTISLSELIDPDKLISPHSYWSDVLFLDGSRALMEAQSFQRSRRFWFSFNDYERSVMVRRSYYGKEKREMAFRHDPSFSEDFISRVHAVSKSLFSILYAAEFEVEAEIGKRPLLSWLDPFHTLNRLIQEDELTYCEVDWPGREPSIYRQDIEPAIRLELDYSFDIPVSQ